MQTDVSQVLTTANRDNNTLVATAFTSALFMTEVYRPGNFCIRKFARERKDMKAAAVAAAYLLFTSKCPVLSPVVL
jgi:hypothetical protein